MRIDGIRVQLAHSLCPESEGKTAVVLLAITPIARTGRIRQQRLNIAYHNNWLRLTLRQGPSHLFPNL